VKQTQNFGGETGEDADGNKITKSGLKKAAPPAAPAAANADPRAARFDERDLNHDGKLSLEEFIATAADKAGAKARFEKFDTDKDGFLSREEFMKQGKK